jgi:hypothetical protein
VTGDGATGRPPPDPDRPAELELVGVVEDVDLPVVFEPSRPPIVRAAPQAAALVQTAAVAATGFVAGVATAAVLGRRRARRLAGPAVTEPGGVRLRAVSHRTYLVDVHQIERR